MAEEAKKNVEETVEAPAEAKDAVETPAGEAVAEAPAEAVAVAEKAPEPKRTAPPLPEGAHYVWGTGRRKRAVARVRIRPGSGKILINKREVTEFFPALRDQNSCVAPLDAVGMMSSWDVWVNIGGGGTTGQAGAVSLGLARALKKAMPELEQTLRDRSMLTRDARQVERKKYGQRGARRRFQFSKR
jgi:small subunit ribosomal protein S9